MAVTSYWLGHGTEEILTSVSNSLHHFANAIPPSTFYTEELYRALSTAPELIIFCLFYLPAFRLRPLSISVSVTLGLDLPHWHCCPTWTITYSSTHQWGSTATPVSSTDLCQFVSTCTVQSNALAMNTSIYKCEKNNYCHITIILHIAITKPVGQETLRAEFTSWILQTGLSWMKGSGQCCSVDRTVRQNLLPRHRHATRSTKPEH